MMQPKQQVLLRSCTGFLAVIGLLVACGGPDSDLTTEKMSRDAAGGTIATVAHTHETAEESCFICDPTKRDKGRLWCQEHARYEDRCWLCRPAMEDKSRPFCSEHSLYEDECSLCNAGLQKMSAIRLDPERVSGGEEISPELFCNEHSVLEMECGICQPQLASSLNFGESLLVRLPSADSAAKAGIRSEKPARGVNTAGLQVLCEAQYNGNRITRVTPLTDGIVIRVSCDVGDLVHSGEVLAELHTMEAARAKSAYLSSLVDFGIKKETRDREERLLQGSISAKKDFLSAEGEFRMARLAANNARQKLLNLGLNAQEITEIERTEDASAILKIRAPFDGTLIDRDAVTGQFVESKGALFTLADLSTRWLLLSLPADRLTGVRVGLPVEARFNELPGETILGTLVWIDTAVDKRTRLVRARALVSSAVDRIKAGMFGQAKIITRSPRPGLLVPRDAVQHYEQRPYVFVRQDRDLFALRHVNLGDASIDSVEILSGLHPKEAVVTSGFLVMSEFLKSRLGAGCVDD